MEKKTTTGIVGITLAGKLGKKNVPQHSSAQSENRWKKLLKRGGNGGIENGKKPKQSRGGEKRDKRPHIKGVKRVVAKFPKGRNSVLKEKTGVGN